MPKFLFFYLSNIALRFIVLTESNGATHRFDIILISLNRPKQHGLLHHGKPAFIRTITVFFEECAQNHDSHLLQ